MRTALRRDLTAALRARDPVAVAALRSALAAIENAEAPASGTVPPSTAGSAHIAGSVAGLGATEVPRRRLSDADLQMIIATEVAERRAAAAEYERLDRPDRAHRLRSEVEVLRRYLTP